MENTKNKINKAENKRILKDLKQYSKSDSYKKFTEFCRLKKEEIDNKIDTLLEKRDNSKAITLIGSYVTEKGNTIKILKEMRENASNEVFKEWFSERIRREKSAIYNSPELESVTYTDLDLLKSMRRDYFGGEFHLLDFCTGIYEEQKEVDYFQERNPYVF